MIIPSSENNNIDNTSVGLLRQTLVLAAISGLHVKYRDVTLLGCNRAKAAIRIAKDEERIRLLGFKDRIDGDEDLTRRNCRVAARRIEEMIRLTKSEIFKEDFVKLVVIVLTRMHENVLNRRRTIQSLQNTRKANDLGARTDDCEDFEFLHMVRE